MFRNFGSVLMEMVVLLALGVALALAANQLSPRGLSLTRDYFAVARPAPVPSAVSPPDPVPVPESAAAAVKKQLEEKGISVVETDEVEALFRDPRYEQEMIIFIDARGDRPYQEGHIPGAYQFDRYYPERYLPSIMPACLNAETIVVYCTGGKCEDSDFAAMTLVDAGIPAPNVSVYLGGITEWTAQGHPVETGFRRSGVLRANSP
jgi:rhodanese-related sulfurtransferase